MKPVPVLNKEKEKEKETKKKKRNVNKLRKEWKAYFLTIYTHQYLFFWLFVSVYLSVNVCVW